MINVPLRARIAGAVVVVILVLHMSLVKVAPASGYAQKTHYSLWGGPNLPTDRHRVEDMYEKTAVNDFAAQAGRNTTRANAAFVILARNSDLWSIMESIRFMEDRFNRKYKYAQSRLPAQK